MATGAPANSGTSAEANTKDLPTRLREEMSGAKFGLPRFDWSITFVGLCIFTFSVVSSRYPFAEVGVAVALLGLFLQKEKILILIK